ncbi:MAG: hypothetical protein ACYTGX_02005 [Planctomycetota bacterium]|jgi:hypothetical protein
MIDGGGCLLALVRSLFFEGLFWSGVENQAEVNIAMPAQPPLRRIAASVVLWAVLLALVALAIWGLAR